MKQWYVYSLSMAIMFLVTPAFATMQFQDCMNAYHDAKPEAYEYCLPFIESGNNREALKIMGDMYFQGWGEKVTQDYEQAMLFYKRAASRGDRDAKYHIAVMYEKGLGTPEDYTMAARWYRSAATEGHPDAQYNLGNMYSKGAGVRQDDVASASWYERAAKQGEPLAQYNMGNRYAKGLGVTQDLMQAYVWYSLAEKSGDKDAKKNKVLLKELMTPEEIMNAEKHFVEWRAVKE